MWRAAGHALRIYIRRKKGCGVWVGAAGRCGWGQGVDAGSWAFGALKQFSNTVCALCRAYYIPLRIAEVMTLAEATDFRVNRPIYIVESGTFLLCMNGERKRCIGCKHNNAYCNQTMKCDCRADGSSTCPWRAVANVEVNRKNSSTGAVALPMCRLRLTKSLEAFRDA